MESQLLTSSKTFRFLSDLFNTFFSNGHTYFRPSFIILEYLTTVHHLIKSKKMENLQKGQFDVVELIEDF